MWDSNRGLMSSQPTSAPLFLNLPPLLLRTAGTLDRCALRGPQCPRLAPPLAQNRATSLSLEAWAARASFQKALFLVKNSTDVFPGMEHDC